MKKFPIIIAFLLCLLAMAACHKDKEMDIKEAIVSNEEITVSATQARFSWQVDFVGQFHTGVELSQNENMSDLRRVEATKEEDGFVAIVDSLAVGKKYYYRIVVWNKFGSYEQPVGDFTTSKTFSIHVSAEPSSGGTVTGGGTFAEGDTCTVVATANAGYNFVNWTENGTQVSTEAEYPFAVTSERNLVAYFTSQEYTITAIADPEEGGTVEGSGGYDNGDECTLRATANDGYEFVNWTKEDGTQVSTNATYRFTVTETAIYVAHFQVKNYTVNVSAIPEEGGSVEGGGTYEYGQSCTVRATEATGHHFVNWTENGGQVSTNEEYTFIVTGDRNLVANFTSQQYTITAIAEPEQGGTVSGSGGYNNGDQCTLTATANEGYEFVNWTDETGLLVSTETTYRFIVEGSAIYFAHFKVQSFSITVSANPVDGGSVYIGNTPGTTQGTFNSGQYCTVHATAHSGYRFVNWTENDSVVSNVSAYGFNVSNDRMLVANFTRVYTINVSANPSNGGTVTGGGVYQQGELCNVTATAKPNYTFVNWMEGSQVVSTEAEFSFTVTGDRTLVAHFEPQLCIITVSANPSNGGTVTGGGTYHEGEVCTVLATANAGYNFTNWTENGSVASNSASYSFIVSGSRNLVANFTQNGGGHAYVDLGLPSGLLWATCNVGADSPEDYGDYFAWGETQPKSVYNWSTYRYCMGSGSMLTKYCNNASYGYNGFIDNLTTLEPNDDAATVNWGTDWHMPTSGDWQELINNTTCTWTTQNGVRGRLFTGTNGQSLFLPAAGYYEGNNINNVNIGGGYWSNSLYTGEPNLATFLDFSSNNYLTFNSSRFYGLSVRPVRSPQ